MSFDLGAALSGLRKVLGAVNDLAPIAQAIGGSAVDNVVSVIAAGASVGSNILDRAAEGKVVLASRDETEVRKILAELQAKNDALNEAIKAS